MSTHRTDTGDPKWFSQADLNDFVKDLYLPKQNAELLGLKLQEKSIFADGTSFYFLQERTISCLFSKETDFVSCTNFLRLPDKFNIEYDKNEWWLYILKTVLLHNGIIACTYVILCTWKSNTKICTWKNKLQGPH